MQRDVFHFKTIDIPYELARQFVRDDPAELFSATLDESIVDKGEIEGVLDVEHDGIILGTDIRLEIGDFEEIVEPLPLAKRKIGWHASEHTGMFPILAGEVEAFPVGSNSTQVTFTCHYRPPMKAVGAIADTVYLHRVAEDCLDRFFDRLVASLENLGAVS